MELKVKFNVNQDLTNEEQKQLLLELLKSMSLQDLIDSITEYQQEKGSSFEYFMSDIMETNDFFS